MLVWTLAILLNDLKKAEFYVQRINKKIKEEAKRQGKRLKAIRKNHIDNNKEKESPL